MRLVEAFPKFNELTSYVKFFSFTFESVLFFVIYTDGTIIVKEIASELGISVQAVRQHIRKAKKLGDIK